ncbi:hypothetical protein, partial [Streptomyces sp. H27-H5]|uniref:hypothetical protein n=1 Tax=Streptomyces sp. H27-H5 TaxID=2996460 RepID=UPI00226FC650
VVVHLAPPPSTPRPPLPPPLAHLRRHHTMTSQHTSGYLQLPYQSSMDLPYLTAPSHGHGSRAQLGVRFDVHECSGQIITAIFSFKESGQAGISKCPNHMVRQLVSDGQNLIRGAGKSVLSHDPTTSTSGGVANEC